MLDDTDAIAPAPGAEEAALPQETEIAIIGGGIVGVSAAILLAEWGVPCVLLEKGRVGAEQSSRNWGWVRMLGRAESEIPLMVRAQALWQRFAPEAGETGLVRRGVTYLAETEADMARHEAWRELAKVYQIAPRALTPAQAAEAAGRSDTRLLGGMTLPTDMHAEPALAVPALAARARTLGAHIAEGVAVRGLLREGGRVAGVVTERGTIRCRAAILAGGAWSRTFLENEGLSFPQLAVLSSVLRTAPMPSPSPGPVGAGSAAIRPRRDGGLAVAQTNQARIDLIPAAFTHLRAFVPLLRARWRMVSIGVGRAFTGPLGRHRWEMDQTTPFEHTRILDPAPRPKALARIERGARDLYPGLADMRVAETWAGLIDVMPDEEPVIDHAPIPGLVIATGMSGHGFGLGPGAGLLAAQLATGRAPEVDPTPFRLSRF